MPGLFLSITYLHRLRVGLVRIELVGLDGAADVLGVDRALLCQRRQRRHHDQ